LFKALCATHKKLLHCSKDYGKICSTLNGLTQQRIKVFPLLTSVSSTLLHWSGFKRNLVRVAFFLYLRWRRGRCLRDGMLISGDAGGLSGPVEPDGRSTSVMPRRHNNKPQSPAEG
jgi:hypothetical protein